MQTEELIVETLSPVDDKGPARNITSLFAQVVDITRDLFPGAVSAELLDDPEYPQDRYMVFTAQFHGAVEESVERQLEWHRRVARLGETFSDLSLSLDFRQ
jgi:hypothetical protein